jgi:hypothetical protein
MTTEAIQGSLIDPEVKKVLEANSATGVKTTAKADLAAIRTAVIAALTAVDTLATAVNALATKLNADAGVTDVNYVTNNATNNAATSSPAALTTV